MAIPKVIFLQIGDDVLPEQFDEIALNGDEVTWCVDRIYETDIEYHLSTPPPNQTKDVEDEL